MFVELMTKRGLEMFGIQAIQRVKPSAEGKTWIYLAFVAQPVEIEQPFEEVKKIVQENLTTQAMEMSKKAAEKMEELSAEMSTPLPNLEDL